jgi:hypothetical protein
VKAWRMKQGRGSQKANGKNKKKRTGRKKKPEIGYQYEYEDPLDYLNDAPVRICRPRFLGDLVGEVFVYGDELIYGCNHKNSKDRYDLPFIEILRRPLKQKGYHLVAEGLPGRTTFYKDENMAEKLGVSSDDFNGMEHFGTTFSCLTPLFLVILLGRNDLKKHIRRQLITEVDSSDEDESNGSNTSDTDEEEEGEDEISYKYLHKLVFQDTVTKEDVEDPDFLAEAVIDRIILFALKAKELFKGFVHEGNLKIMFITPPVIKLTPKSRKLGYDEVSVEASKILRKKFPRICMNYSFINVYSQDADDDILKNSKDGINLTINGSDALAMDVYNAMLTEFPRRVRKKVSNDYVNSDTRRNKKKQKKN